MDNNLTAFAYETLTIGSGNASTSLTKTVYQAGGVNPKAATITIGSGPRISYMFGTTVTVSSATGHVGTPFGVIPLYGHQQIRDFRTTSVSSGTTATIMVTYWR